MKEYRERATKITRICHSEQREAREPTLFPPAISSFELQASIPPLCQGMHLALRMWRLWIGRREVRSARYARA